MKIVAPVHTSLLTLLLLNPKIAIGLKTDCRILLTTLKGHVPTRISRASNHWVEENAPCLILVSA